MTDIHTITDDDNSATLAHVAQNTYTLTTADYDPEHGLQVATVLFSRNELLQLVANIQTHLAEGA